MRDEKIFFYFNFYILRNYGSITSNRPSVICTIESLSTFWAVKLKVPAVILFAISYLVIVTCPVCRESVS